MVDINNQLELYRYQTGHCLKGTEIMPRPEMAWIVQRQIKREMVSYKYAEGKALTAPACLRRLEEWALAMGIPDKAGLIPTNAKTIQKKMTQFKNEGIYDKPEDTGLEQKFQLGESLGEGANQIPWKYAGRAREITQLYLSTLRTEPEIGLIRQYIRVSQMDLEWTDVQQKALKAEIFWAHELLKDVPDVDEGSTRYEELQIIFQTYKHSANSKEYMEFQKIVAEEGLEPWAVRMPVSVLPLLPQFNHVAKGNSPINAASIDHPTPPQLRSDDDYEPPLPGTPDDATIQLMKDAPSPYGNLDSLAPTPDTILVDESPPLQQIKYDEDGKPIKPWEKKK